MIDHLKGVASRIGVGEVRDCKNDREGGPTSRRKPCMKTVLAIVTLGIFSMFSVGFASAQMY